jgi:hypothetical protein
MRTETINLYKFNELPTERAKERARDWWRSASDLAWSDESRESIQAFCAHFGVTLRDWSVGPYAPIDYSTDAENRHFRGHKLRDFTREHMPTGYCLDCDLWQTFYDEFKRAGDAKGAFESALDAGFKAWRADMEGQFEDEYVDKHLEINEYEFTEDGQIH